MSIVFFGTPRFAVPALEALAESNEQVTLVVTQPDRRRGRGRKESMPAVKASAREKGIEVIQPANVNDSRSMERLRQECPEFMVVVAYGRILRRELLDIPSRGCINVHASLLPRYRGAAPVQWAIINGDSTTGVTTMLMDEGMDTGDILLSRETRILAEDTSESLSERLSLMGAELLLETIHGIRSGRIRPQPQKGTPSHAPILRKEDGLIDWSREAAELFNFVRGMYPWPCAFTRFRGRHLKILESRVVEGIGEPGRIEGVDGEGIVVGTGRGMLSVRRLQPEGKRAMDARSFANGYRIRGGERFE